MKKNILLIIVISSVLFIINGCVTIKYNDYAETNFDEATKYINQLKDDTILVALPMYQEEEDIYKGAIQYGKKDVDKNKARLLKLQNRRMTEVKESIIAFEEHFNFARALYIPDSLVHSFERGEERPFFLNTNGELDNSIIYNNRTPIKIIQPSDYSWNVVVGDDILPNPFPNGYAYKNGLVIFLGLAPHDKMVTELAKKLQLRFNNYYHNPSRRLHH